MSIQRIRGIVLSGAFAVVLTGSAAQAGRVRDVALGLGAIGFNIEGDHNFLSGGVDLLVNRNFVGNPLDFGTWDLAMFGPLSLDISTGRRLVPTFDISLSTAPNGDATPRTFSYAYNADLGIQSQEIQGNVLLDARASFNALGYYDLAFEYAAEQVVTFEGQINNMTGEGTREVPRVEYSGHVVVDVLALVTQPLFAASGAANPFLALSGDSSLAAVVLDPDQTALRRLATGEAGVGFEGVTVLPAGQSFDSGTARISPFGRTRLSGGVMAGAVVPEPTSLVLLLFGVPAIMRRR